MNARCAKLIAMAVIFSFVPLTGLAADAAAEKGVKRLLYVTAPDGAMRNRAKPGIYVYDIDDGHKLVKHISIPDMGGTRGCAASAVAGKLYISHKNTYMMCFDIVKEKKVWEISYPKIDGGFDRTCITPDGKKLYVPEGWWSHTANSMAVLDGNTGKLIRKIDLGVNGGHNSIMSISGKRMYLGSVRSGHIFVIDTTTDKIIKKFGPFGKDPSGKKGRVSPYCINGAETLCFVNSHDVGFYVGDLVNQKVLHWVQVKGARGFSHGVGLTPDEKELWLPNPSDKRMLIFDATVMPPKQVGSIDVRSKSHGWITFSLDGKYAWTDTGEVIDAKTKKIVATLKGIDGKGLILSSKFIEIQFKDGKPIKVGDQFGIGRVVPKAKLKPKPKPKPELKIETTSSAAPEQGGVDFRVDVFQRGKDGYH
ncbi:MAG: hypothetical protein QGH94_16175, partial [Phycisphaerae bacterium]|nr:hypothetical protein [Phycisphaerae bacterium]